MKPAAVFSALFFAALVGTAQAAAPAQPPNLTGLVLETRNVGSYTYLRLRTASGEIWAAVPTATVSTGAQVTIRGAVTMENFESKTLKKTFDKIAFGVLDDPKAKASSLHGTMPARATGIAAAKVAKASGPEAKTVAEVIAGKAALKDKTVVVRGQVVKVSAGILGKNWLHLRDGSGSAADGNNDILVTTQDPSAVGDIVSARGTVRTDVDLGVGYTYAVIIAGAALRK